MLLKWSPSSSSVIKMDKMGVVGSRRVLLSMKYVFKKKMNIILITIFDAIGYFFRQIFHRCKHAPKKGPKSVLIIRMDHLGDVLAATALPKVIKESLSGCRVIFLTASWAAPLLENNPFIDEILIYDAPWFSKKRYKKNSKSFSFHRVIKTLKNKKIDAGMGLRGDLRENWIMALAGIKERIGYGITGGGFFLTKEVAYRHDAHESEHQKDLLGALGLKVDSLEPSIYLSDDERAHFEKRLEPLGLAGDKNFICLLLGSGAPSKDWPASNVDEFIKLFVGHFPAYRIILVGSSRRISDQLKTGSNERVLNLVGETSLRELCLLIKKSKFFIGPESGPTHVASVLGVPTLFLYSGTNDYERWKPPQEAAMVLRHHVPCSPCESTICRVEGHPCMDKILPEEVLKLLQNKLR